MRLLETDYLIIGAGVAGLSCSLQACQTGEVILMTRDGLPAGNTVLAQGGIAAALSRGDTPELHYRDTLRAGAGLCNRQAVKVLVEEGVRRVQELLAAGFPCDRGENGRPVFGREGAHSVARVISSGGDGSGKALAETLVERVRERENIHVHEQVYALELLTRQDRCLGLLAYDLNSHKPVVYTARAVVLATGGCGQVFAHTTNHVHCTGDGFALAYRCGAVLENMEFVQFHPTALKTGENPMFLISEAVRGKGALLVNDKGERFMSGLHPLAELAPRDVVARGIYGELKKGNQVYLDVSPLGSGFKDLFPNIYRNCVERGYDPPGEPIPVTPAAHFIMGGVKTDLYGRTNIKGLYACGEVASTGVHGANRLASNSLLEGLVFGHRAGRAVAEEERKADKAMLYAVLEKILQDRYGGNPSVPILAANSGLITELRSLMWDRVGLIRCGRELGEAVKRLQEMRETLETGNIIAENTVTVAYLIAAGALSRRESRGSHFRIDCREPANGAGALQEANSL